MMKTEIQNAGDLIVDVLNLETGKTETVNVSKAASGMQDISKLAENRTEIFYLSDVMEFVLWLDSNNSIAGVEEYIIEFQERNGIQKSNEICLSYNNLVDLTVDATDKSWYECVLLVENFFELQEIRY